MKYLLLFSGLAAGAVMVATVIIDSPLAYVGGLCIAGFLVGATVPLSIARGNNMMPGYSGAVSSLLTFASVAGLLFFPWLIGVIADASGFWYGIALTALFPFAISLFSAFCQSPGQQQTAGNTGDPAGDRA